MLNDLQENRMIQLGGETFLIHSHYMKALRSGDEARIKHAEAVLVRETLWLVTQIIKEILNREGVEDHVALAACKQYAANELKKMDSEKTGDFNVE